MTTRDEATSFGDRTVVVTRVFDASREEVFRFFADPGLLAQWFAPAPLTVPVSEGEVRPGGHYRITMRDEDGNEYTSVGAYEEVIEPERLVYTDSATEMPAAFLDMLNEARGMPAGTPVADGLVTLIFEDANGKTKLTYYEEFDSGATRDGWVELQMVEGLSESFDNLEKLLAKTPAHAR